MGSEFMTQAKRARDDDTNCSRVPLSIRVDLFRLREFITCLGYRVDTHDLGPQRSYGEIKGS